MNKLLLSLLLLVAAPAAFAQTAAPAAQQAQLPAYGTAKTIEVPFSSKRALILDDGVKRKLKSAYLEDEKGKPLRFESEAAVLNYLAGLGWDVTANGQEQTPNGVFNLYQLKRRQTP